MLPQGIPEEAVKSPAVDLLATAKKKPRRAALKGGFLKILSQKQGAGRQSRATARVAFKAVKAAAQPASAKIPDKKSPAPAAGLGEGPAGDRRVSAVRNRRKSAEGGKGAAQAQASFPAMTPAARVKSQGAELKNGAGETAVDKTAAAGSAGPAGRAELKILDLRSRRVEEKTAKGFPPAGKGEAGSEAAPSSREPRLKEAELSFQAREPWTRSARTEPKESQDLSRGAGEIRRAFQDRMVPEVVQHTQIILRDGGEGEIRLVLRPESLGSVRIRVQMHEGHLEGRILVENNTVKELFDSSLSDLKAALRGEGFGEAKLEVAVGGGQGRQGEGSHTPLPPPFPRSAAPEFEKALSFFPLVGEEGLVNLVV